MAEPIDYVRPTRRCLSELKVDLPDLGTLLHELEHPLIMRAQQVPERVRAGSGERIRSLTDRVWFKVKTSAWRGAAGQLPPVIESIDQTWWLVAGGTRADDSAQHDFYSRISADAHSGGANTCSTDFLLPDEWDAARFLGEVAVFAQRVVRAQTRVAAGESLLNGDIRAFDIGDRNVRVRVKLLDDGQVYLAIGTTGSIDREFVVTLLSAIPGLSGEDWMPEPSDTLGFDPSPGEILWSAMIGPNIQEELVALAKRDW
jgi:hypothetical protein